MARLAMTRSSPDKSAPRLTGYNEKDTRTFQPEASVRKPLVCPEVCRSQPSRPESSAAKSTRKRSSASSSIVNTVHVAAIRIASL
jgi:hypothetical protein